MVFQEIFLITNTVIEVILGMFFLAFSKVKINFADQKLNWKTDTLNNALLTTKQIEMIDQRDFIAAALALDKKAFVIHIAYLETKISIYPV